MRTLPNLVAIAAVGALALSLGACSPTNSSDGSKSTDGIITVKVGASPTPHSKILRELEANGAAKKAGIKIDVVDFQDYVKPNLALADGEIEANYFQTVPYLDDQKKENKKFADFNAGKGIHLEPLGLYPGKVKKLTDLKDGATIGIINDPTNQGRALKLLIDNGLIKKPAGELNVLSLKADKAANPRNFDFKEVEGPQLARVVQDVDAAVINGNFAQSGGLKPADALALEKAEGNPAVNILVWKGKESEGVKKLDELLHSPETKAYIEKTWADKSVIAAF